MYVVMNHVIPRYIHPLSRHWLKSKPPMYVVMNRGMRCYVHSPRWHWPQSRRSHAAADALGRWCSGSWRAWWSPRPPPGQRWCWVAPQTSSRSATRRKHVRPVSFCTARSYVSLKTNSCTACTRRTSSIASLKTAMKAEIFLLYRHELWYIVTTVLCSTGLYCTVSSSAAVYCNLLYCIVLYRTVLACAVCITIYCNVVSWTILSWAVLDCNLLYSIVLCRTVLARAVMHYNPLYCNLPYCVEIWNIRYERNVTKKNSCVHFTVTGE